LASHVGCLLAERGEDLVRALRWGIVRFIHHLTQGGQLLFDARRARLRFVGIGIDHFPLKRGELLLERTGRLADALMARTCFRAFFP